MSATLSNILTTSDPWHSSLALAALQRPGPPGQAWPLPPQGLVQTARWLCGKSDAQQEANN